MYLRGAESVFLGWHHIDFAMVHHIDNRLLAPAMQPNFVAEVWGAQGLVALAVYAVTRCTYREFVFTPRSLE